MQFTSRQPFGGLRDWRLFAFEDIPVRVNKLSMPTKFGGALDQCVGRLQGDYLFPLDYRWHLKIETERFSKSTKYSQLTLTL